MVDVDVSRLGNILAETQIDALCLTHPPNLRHLCGFSGSDGALVVSLGKSWFLTDSRYTTQAMGEVLGAEVRQYAQKTEGVCELLAAEGFRRVGFEAAHVTVAQLGLLERTAKERVEWVPLKKQLDDLRSLKTAPALHSIRRAADISAEAFAQVLPLIRPGHTESSVALELEIAMLRAGGEEKSFEIIVASGERGALPHGVASDKILAPGELVTIDFGTRYQGYCSDETVTVALGAVKPELRTLFDTVLAAHDRAMEAVRPGVELKSIDAVARSYIAECGYGDYFGHGLGHGVGYEIHEYPVVSPRSEAVAEEGMVFTIEPGIYIPGLGGCRIEDMVVVTKEGCEVLTSIPKHFTAFDG